MSDSIMDILYGEEAGIEEDYSNKSIKDILYGRAGNDLEQAKNRRVVEGEDPASYWTSRVPLVGSIGDVNRVEITLHAAKKYEQGDRSEETIEALAEHFAQYGREQDKEFGEKVFDLATSIPGFALEFVATGGAFKWGTSAAKKVLGKYAERAVGKAVAAAIGATAQTLANPQLIAKNAASRLVDDYGLARDEEGALVAIIDSEEDDFISAMGKGFLDSLIEIGSEHAGKAIGLINKSKLFRSIENTLTVYPHGSLVSKIPLASKIKAVKAGLLRHYADMAPEGFKDAVSRLATQAGWHGVIGEMFEERVGDIARYATGLEDEMFHGDLEQYLVEGTAFAIPGMITVAGGMVAGKVDSMIVKKMIDAEIERTKDFEEAMAEASPEAIEKIAEIEGSPSRKDIDTILGPGKSKTIGDADAREEFKERIKEFPLKAIPSRSPGGKRAVRSGIVTGGNYPKFRVEPEGESGTRIKFRTKPAERIPRFKVKPEGDTGKSVTIKKPLAMQEDDDAPAELEPAPSTPTLEEAEDAGAPIQGRVGHRVEWVTESPGGKRTVRSGIVTGGRGDLVFVDSYINKKVSGEIVRASDISSIKPEGKLTYSKQKLIDDWDASDFESSIINLDKSVLQEYLAHLRKMGIPARINFSTNKIVDLVKEFVQEKKGEAEQTEQEAVQVEKTREENLTKFASVEDYVESKKDSGMTEEQLVDDFEENYDNFEPDADGPPLFEQFAGRQEEIKDRVKKALADQSKPAATLDDLDNLDDDALADMIAAQLNAGKQDAETTPKVEDLDDKALEDMIYEKLSAGLRAKQESETTPSVEEAPAPAKKKRRPPKKKPSHKEKADEARKELDDALDEIGNLGLFSQPIQPHAIKPFLKVTKALIKLGYHEFADMIRVMSEKFGHERVANGSDILEAIWALVRDNYDSEGKLGEVGDTKAILKELSDGSNDTADGGLGDSVESPGGNESEGTDRPDTQSEGNQSDRQESGDGDRGDTGSDREDSEDRPDVGEQDNVDQGEGSERDTDAGESELRPDESDQTDERGDADDSEVQDYRVPDDIDEVAPRGQITQLKANIAAIKILKKLEGDVRAATDKEKEALAKYTGWGNIKQVFDTVKSEASKQAEESSSQPWNFDANWDKKYYSYHKELKDLLTQGEWIAAGQSTLFAHYTSIPVMRGLWKMAERLGFDGGNVLEPAAGVGHFLGTAPRNINAMAVEIDPISGAIAKHLYPNVEVFDGKGFEDVEVPVNSIDLAITNVPFSETGPADAQDRYGQKLNLHNYFIARMLDAIKPGGLAITITSPYTMGGNIEQRKFLASKADLVASFRLPNNAFKSNAGTEVSADILIFRKPDGSQFKGERWISILPGKTYRGQDLEVNEYFLNHPDHVLGRMSLEGTMYRSDEYATIPDPKVSIEEQLERAVELLPESISSESGSNVDFSSIRDISEAREGAIIEKGDWFDVIKDGERVPIDRQHKFLAKNKKNKALIKSYLDLKAHFKGHLDLMIQDETTDKQVEESIATLNELYDHHVAAEWMPKSQKARGNNFINALVTKRLKFDPDYYLMSSLETAEEVFDKETLKGTIEWVKGPALLRRTRRPQKPPTSAENIMDGVRISLGYKGKIDLDWVAELSGKSLNEVETELSKDDLAFHNPATGLWEQKDTYLSGNVRTKLKDAERAVKGDRKFERNVDALKEVQPEMRAISDIRFRLGGTWIPEDTIKAFLTEELDSPEAIISYNRTIDSWRLDGLSGNIQVRETYAVVTDGSVRLDAEQMLRKILNMKSLTIKMNVGTSREPRYVVDERATAEARIKAEALQTAFQRWLKDSEEHSTKMQDTYNEAFNFLVPPDYDGEHLMMPGSTVSLYPHQKNQIWRWLLEGHGMAALAVGAGKTFVYIGAAMEMKRMGLAQKPLIVVQNATLEQFAAAAKSMYPGGNFLVASKEDLQGANRQRFMGRVQSGDFDAVIMAQSSFNLLPNDPAREEGWFVEQIQELTDAMSDVSEDEGERSPTVRDIQRKIRNLDQKLRTFRQRLARRQVDPVNFEDLGIDALFIDEAHEFKKLPVISKLGQIRGLNLEGSQRGVSLLLKTKFIQESNSGRGVFLGTGTPITNTMGEAFNMLRLASPQLLQEFGVDSFDRWVSTFGVIEETPVQNAAGRLVMREVLNKFQNGVELLKLIFGSWNVVTLEDLQEFFGESETAYPSLAGGGTKVEGVPVTPQVKQFMDFVRTTYSRWEGLEGREKREFLWVPVVLFGAARAAALDIRMVYPNAKDHPGSKVNLMVDRAMELYEEADEHKGAQLIFSDSIRQTNMENILAFANGQGVAMQIDAEDNVEDNDEAEDEFLYQDVKKKLISRGVPENEIAIISEYNDKKREALFQMVNSGDIRFLIGSTAKMGIGVNVQERLYAIHHLDTPFMPMQLEQRQGRILRQGNGFARIGNGEVHEISWGMKGTLDGAIFDTVLRKAKFTRQILGGRGDIKEFDFPSDVTIEAAQEMMMAVFDPRGRRRVELQKQIRDLRMQEETFEESKERNVWKKRELEERIGRLNEKLIPQVKSMQAEAEEVLAKDFKVSIQSRRRADQPLTSKDYTDKKEAVAAIDEFIASSKERIKQRRLDEGFDLHLVSAEAPITFNDDIAVHLRFTTRSSNDSNGNLVVEVRSASSEIFFKNEEVDSTDAGTGQGLSNVIAQLKKRADQLVEKYEERLARSEKEMDRANEFDQDSEFPSAQELEDSIQELAQLETDIQAEDEGAALAERERPNEGLREGGDIGDRPGPSSELPKHPLGVKGRTDAKGNTRPISRQAIIKRVERIFGIPSGSGWFRGRASGIYRSHPEVVRFKETMYGDLSVAAHEIGHHIWKKAKLKEKIPSEIAEELEGLDYDRNRGSAEEGFSEFLRFYLTRDDSKKDAPKFHEWWLDYLALNENWGGKVSRFRSLVDQWRDQGALNRVREHVRHEPSTPAEETFKEHFGELVYSSMTGAYIGAKDELHAFKVLQDEAQKRGYSPNVGGGVYERAMAFKSAGPQLAAQAIRNGPMTMDEDPQVIGPSMADALSEIKPEQYEDFSRWMIVNHQLEDGLTEKQTGINVQDALAFRNKFDSEAFRNTHKKLIDFNNALIEMLASVGAITEKDKDRILEQYKAYSPLWRVTESNRDRIPSRYVDLGPVVRARKGSGREILDPIVATIMRANRFYSAASRQLIQNAMIDIYRNTSGMGDWLEKVPPKMKATTFNLKEIREELEGLFGEDEMEDLEIDALATIFRADYSRRKGDPVISTTVNGNKELYFVRDEYLYDALNAFEPFKLPALVEFFAGNATRMVKLGAVGLNASFGTKNPVADLITFAFQTKRNLKDIPIGVAKSVGYTFKGLYDKMRALSGSSDRDVFLQFAKDWGVELSHVMGEEVDAVRNTIDDIMADSVQRRAYNIARHPLDSMVALIGISEMGPRVAELEHVLKKHGITKSMLKSGRLPKMSVIVEAINEANDVTVNFKRQGSWGKTMNRLSAFWNASAESLDKMIRSGIDNPARFAILASATAMATAAYWFYRKDDDEYQEEEAWLKYGFFNYTSDSGDHLVRIPRGHGYGWVMSASIEAMLNQWHDEDPEAVQEWAKESFENMLPDPAGMMLEPGDMFRASGGISLLRPFSEAASDKDTFKNRPIEGRLKNLPAPQRYTGGTTWLARKLGKLTNTSPMHIDHIMGGLTGGLSTRIQRYEGGPIGVAGFTIYGEPKRSVNEMYDRADEIAKEYEGEKKKLGEATAETKAARYRIKKAQELISMIRPYYRDGGKTKYREGQRYMISIARAALGKAPLERYPGFLTVDSSVLPPELVKERSNWIKKARRAMKENRPVYYDLIKRLRK